MLAKSPIRLPTLTAEQQLFLLTHLSLEKPYTEICHLFLEQYPAFGSDFDSEVVSSRLYDTIRKLKTSRSDEIADIGKSLIRSKDADYRFKFLDKMLHETPDVEVVYKTPEGVEKTRCNRLTKLKIIEAMEKIEGGAFDKVSGGSVLAAEVPRIRPADFFSSGGDTKEVKRLKSPDDGSDTSE